MNLVLRSRLVRRWRQQRINISRRLLRDSADPLSLDTEMFIRNYRVKKELYCYLCQIIKEKIATPLRCTSITIEVKILTTLNFLGTGSYQKPIGQDWLAPISQPTVSRCIEAVVEALNDVLTKFIKFPTTEQESTKIKQECFFEKFRLPGVIGCIDGTLIAITAPRKHPSEAAFFSRKGYHAINVAIICDSDMKISGVCAKFGGAAHDSYVWRSWSLSRYVEEQYNHGIIGWLLGDSGYPHRPWLMTPVLHSTEDTPEANYTKMHVRARFCVKRCIGLLKARWRCLFRHRVLHYESTKCAKIVNACAILHNLSLNDDIRIEIDHGDKQSTCDENSMDSVIRYSSRQVLIDILWQNRRTI